MFARMNQNKLIKNGFYNAIKTLSSIVFPVITIPYITRVLSVDSMGRYNFANSIVGYFVLIASLGIETYAIRECSKLIDNRAKLEKVASEIFSLNICAMVISYILLIILLLVYSYMRSYLCVILILSINIILPILGTDWLNTAREDFFYVTNRTIFFQLVALICMFVFVKKPDDYIIFAVINVIATSGVSITNIFHIRKFCKLHFTISTNLNKHFKPAVLMFSLLIAQNILSNFDVTMIGILLGDRETGLYSMSVKLYITVEKVISSIAVVLLPQLSSLFEEKKYLEINFLLHRVYNFIYSMAVPMSVGLIFLSKEILVLVCGNDYESAATSLSILSISMFVSLLGGSFWGNIVLLPSGGEGRLMIACVAGAVVNAVLNLYCIPKWGIVGAAVTTVISTIVIFIVCRYKKEKKLIVKLSAKEIIGPIIGGMIIASICLVSKYLFISYFSRIVFSMLLSIISYYIILNLFENEFLIVLKNYLLVRGNEKND